MEELDFTKPPPEGEPAPAAAPPAPSAPFRPAASRFYDRAVAERIFRAFGQPERFAAGATLFAEDQKASSGGLFSKASASRMFFIVSGSVALAAGGRALDTIGAGEVVGEMAVITERPRSATAVAKADCEALGMSAEALHGALAKMPEFAMMLMSVMFDRLRFATARLAMRKGGVPVTAPEPPVFDGALLPALEAALPRAAVARYPAGATIMREGQTGTCFYVVKSGTVAIGVRDKLVAAVGPGGTFGEMAVVDQSPRSASAIAHVDCELLAIDRAALMAAVAAQPAFAIALLRAVAERLRLANTALG